MTGYEDILNGVVDDNIEKYVGDGFKSQALAVEQGASKALTDNQTTQAVVAWDDATTANVVYLKYLSGKINKINQTNGTILTAQSGAWADRATLTYTEGGV